MGPIELGCVYVPVPAINFFVIVVVVGKRSIQLISLLTKQDMRMETRHTTNNEAESTQHRKRGGGRQKIYDDFQSKRFFAVSVLGTDREQSKKSGILVRR